MSFPTPVQADDPDGNDTGPRSTLPLSRERSALDYSALLERHDPDHLPIDAHHALEHSPIGAYAEAGRTSPALPEDHARIFGIVVRHWAACGIPPVGINTMAGVFHGFLAGLPADMDPTTWANRSELLQTFIAHGLTADDEDRFETAQLRRNTLNAALLSLRALWLIDGKTPLAPALDLPRNRDKRPTDERHRRAAKTVGYDLRDHVRAATHDEVLLARLASRLVQTQCSTHRCAATFALATSTATVTEIPQVTWIDRGPETVTLRGRISANGNAEKDIAKRTAALDLWASTALDDWHTEAQQYFGYTHDNHMLYAGSHAADSASAHASVSAQIAATLRLAGLQKTPGLKPESLRLWAATKDAVDLQSAHAAAARAGVSIATLHRQLHQLGERRLRVA